MHFAMTWMELRSGILNEGREKGTDTGCSHLSLAYRKRRQVNLMYQCIKPYT